MRQIVFFITVILIFSCQDKKAENQTEAHIAVKEAATEFEVNEEIHNFGVLNAGERISFSFVLKNIGKEDLIIKSVEGDCGCVIAHFNSEPAEPGSTAIIEVEFDSAGLFGKQFKSVAVETNTIEKIKYLAVVAEVKNEILQINY